MLQLELRTATGRSSEFVAEWDDLVDRIGGSPFHRPGWFAAWWRAFGTGTPQVLRAYRNGRLAGVLPLAGRRGQITSLHNWHTFSCAPIAGDDDVAAELIERALHVAPLLADFGHLPTASADLVQSVGAATGAITRRHLVQRSPYVAVQGSFEEFLAARNGKFLSRIRSRRRKLEREAGPLRLAVRTGIEDGADGLETALGEVFRIESMGWKSANGTAILSDPRTTAFYTGVASWAARRGELQVTTLRLGEDGADQPIAAELALDDGRSHYGLKVGFDPEFRAAGPGFILAHDLLRSAFERRLDTFEFMGSVSEEKLRWTADLRRIWHVRAFPATLPGRSAALGTTGWRLTSAAARRAATLISDARARRTPADSGTDSPRRTAPDPS